MGDAVRHRALYYVNFTAGPWRITPGGLALLGQRVAKGTLRASPDASLAGSAEGAYSIGKNELTFAVETAPSHVVIHELIHALQDSTGRRSEVALAEAVATLGHVVYQLARADLTSRGSAPGLAQRLIASGGFRGAAAKVAVGLGMPKLSHTHVSYADLAPIERAVWKIPSYKSGKVYNFNGIPQPTGPR